MFENVCVLVWVAEFRCHLLCVLWGTEYTLLLDYLLSRAVPGGGSAQLGLFVFLRLDLHVAQTGLGLLTLLPLPPQHTLL